MSTTSITVRLDSTVLQEIDSKCNTESCTRSDFIKSAINEALENEPVAEGKIIGIISDSGEVKEMQNVWVED